MSIIIISEVGINHNGDMKVCKDLIDLSVEAGCDAVKFQKRDINLVYTQELLESPRESPFGTTQREQKLGLEFSEENYYEIDAYCKLKKIDWFASCWDLNSQKFIQQFDCKYNKIASAMIVYEELLEMVATEKKHTFISTGMCTYKDIDKAVEIFKDNECSFELMHTNSTYPSNPEDINLNCIKSLKEKYNCDVGYSGHESGIAISVAAVPFGISSLERHITLDRSMYGSDQSASLEPTGLRQLVGAIKKAESALGDGIKIFSDKELDVAKKLRAHLDWSIS